MVKLTGDHLFHIIFMVTINIKKKKMNEYNHLVKCKKNTYIVYFRFYIFYLHSIM